MPPMVLAERPQLGEHLAIARKRRKALLRAWAQRIGVTESILARMEKGVALRAVDARCLLAVRRALAGARLCLERRLAVAGSGAVYRCLLTPRAIESPHATHLIRQGHGVANAAK